MNSPKIAKLQFISPPTLLGDDFLNQTKRLLDEGLEWVQLRRKTDFYNSEETFKRETIQEAQRLKKLCESYKATLIINDHLWLFKEIDADGIHLGRTDLNLITARKMLGASKIIGTSSNSLSDLEEAFANGANYSGLGPIYPTDTKKNHNPVLGWEKTCQIISDFKKDLPVVLIGGIKQSDLPLHPCLEKCGIALSAALSTTTTIKAYHSFLKKF